jgi:hypothetical protein
MEELVALQSFWSLKKGTKTFYLRSNDRFPDFLGSLVRYDCPWKNKNKYASVIFLLVNQSRSQNNVLNLLDFPVFILVFRE